MTRCVDDLWGVSNRFTRDGRLDGASVTGAAHMLESQSRAIIAANAEIARLKADAERYQWIRQPYDRSIVGVEQTWAEITNRSIDGARMDAVLDEAIAYQCLALAQDAPRSAPLKTLGYDQACSYYGECDDPAIKAETDEIYLLSKLLYAEARKK